MTKLVGFGLIISGIVNGILFLVLRERGAGLLIHALASLLFGLLIVLHPSFIEKSIVIATGIAMIVSGQADMIMFVKTRA